MSGVRGCPLSVTSTAWKVELGPSRALGPARGHCLQAGVEAHSLRTVHGVVPEERPLPSSEAVEGHGNGDRDVDADHSTVHPGGELAGRRTRAGEDRGSVAE